MPHRTERNLGSYNNKSFDRGASAFKELLWRLCQGSFFQAMWYVPSFVRIICLRIFGAQVGKGVIVRAGVNISFPWRLKIGNHVWIGEEVMILSLAPVTIESNVCLSQRAFLCTGSHDLKKSSFDLIVKPIKIEEGCWVAAQAFVGPGVTLGKGAVVSAGSFVFESVMPGKLVRGNPAHVVGSSVAS